MKFSKYWVAAAGLFGISQAQSPSPPFTNVPLNLAPLYFELYEYCIIQGGDTYVGVQFGPYTGPHDIVSLVYGECYPYEINGNVAQMAVFCKSVTCNNNPNPDCTGGATPPVSLPIPAGAALVNAADFVQLIGQAAKCYSNELPI